MNKAMLTGRLTREPDVRWTQGQDQKCYARFTLAVDRRLSREQRAREGAQTADFISCAAFGKTAESVEKYLTKGTKIGVIGRIQTGKYQNREGQTVYTTDVIVEEWEFEEPKGSGSGSPGAGAAEKDSWETGNRYTRPEDADGFIDIPDGVEDDGLPFN